MEIKRERPWFDIPALFLFVQQLNVHYKILPMTGFEPPTSGIGSNCSTDCATTTDHNVWGRIAVSMVSSFYKPLLVVSLCFITDLKPSQGGLPKSISQQKNSLKGLFANTHCRWKYRRTDGLQFGWFGFNYFIWYKQITTHILVSSNTIQLD